MKSQLNSSSLVHYESSDNDDDLQTNPDGPSLSTNESYSSFSYSQPIGPQLESPLSLESHRQPENTRIDVSEYAHVQVLKNVSQSYTYRDFIARMVHNMKPSSPSSPPVTTPLVPDVPQLESSSILSQSNKPDSALTQKLTHWLKMKRDMGLHFNNAVLASSLFIENDHKAVIEYLQIQNPYGSQFQFP